jgi:hypothetical protein
MTKVSFKTEKGSEISIALITERVEVVSLDGDNRTLCNAVWELEITLNGKVWHTARRADHPVAGAAIYFDNNVAPIPADKLAAVDDLIATYRAELDRRMDAKFSADIAYNADHKRITAH